MNEVSTKGNDFTVQLLPHEKLQIHMDCLNALGEIVNVDDVDDMGGVVRELFIYSLRIFFIFVPLNLFSLFYLFVVLDIYSCINSWYQSGCRDISHCCG